MSDAAAAIDVDALDGDELLDDVEFSADEEAALLVALLRWRGPR